MSIAILKKSAKKLHKSLQDGKSLTLMQVQHHLAVSHGYLSWEDALKSEVRPPEVHIDEETRIVYQTTKEHLENMFYIWSLTREYLPKNTRITFTVYPDKDLTISRSIKYGDYQEDPRWEMSTQFFSATDEISLAFLELTGRAHHNVGLYEVVFFVDSATYQKLMRHAPLQRRVARLSKTLT